MPQSTDLREQLTSIAVIKYCLQYGTPHLNKFNICTVSATGCHVSSIIRIQDNISILEEIHIFKVL